MRLLLFLFFPLRMLSGEACVRVCVEGGVGHPSFPKWRLIVSYYGPSTQAVSPSSWQVINKRKVALSALDQSVLRLRRCHSAQLAAFQRLVQFAVGGSYNRVRRGPVDARP